MALIFDQETPFGPPATYHRVGSVQYFYAEGITDVVFFSHINEDYRKAGKMAGTFTVRLPAGMIADPDTQLTRAEIYKMAKLANPSLKTAVDG